LLLTFAYARGGARARCRPKGAQNTEDGGRTTSLDAGH
jgi:hypothetical protein